MDPHRIIHVLKESGIYVNVAEHIGPLASAHSIVRSMLHETCGLSHYPSGQPFLLEPKPSDRSVSLSYSGKLIAVAIREAGPIGVDLELLQEIPEQDIPFHLLTQKERSSILASSDLSAEFLRIWVRKEADAKFQGLGVTAEWSKIETLSDKSCPTKKTYIDTTFQFADQTYFLAVRI